MGFCSAKRVVVPLLLALGLLAGLTASAALALSPEEQTVYVTKTGKKYHTAGCRYLGHSQLPMKLRDAVSSGYTPCSVCRPPRLSGPGDARESAPAAVRGEGQGSGTASRHATPPRRTGTATVPPALAAAAKPFRATGCDDSLWDHVYHPQRLRIVEKCISVTGTIHHIKKEADGDDHIQLTLDPQYAGLLNDRSKTAQANCLVLEPICENPVTQADAVAACRDFHSSVEVAPKGAHVRVLGAYVLDSEANHGWTEIHPVTSITTAP